MPSTAQDRIQLSVTPTATDRIMAFESKTFKKLTDAIAHDPKGKVLAFDLGVNGAKKFSVVDPSTWHETIFSRDVNAYEVLLNTTPTRLFMDIDSPVENGDVHLPDLLRAFHKFTQDRYQFERVVVLTANSETKYSYHLIFPDAVFSSVNTGMKLFVWSFSNWYCQRYIYDEQSNFTFCTKTGKPKSVLDHCVYTTNRCFRLCGQSKRGKKSPPLNIMHSLSFDSASLKDTVLQWDALKVTVDALKVTVDGAILEEMLPSTIPFPMNALCYKQQQNKTKPDTDPKSVSGENTMDASGNNYVNSRSVTWRMVNNGTVDVTYNVKKSTGMKNVLHVRSDTDILSVLDARQLRLMGFQEFFLPILESLATSNELSDDQLIEWTGKRSHKRASVLVNAARAKPPVTFDRVEGFDCTTLNVTCEYALKFLRYREHWDVMDVRHGDRRIRDKNDNEEKAGCTPEIDRWAYPTEQTGFKVLQSSELRPWLSTLMHRDSEFKSTINQRRRLIRVTGKMGVGKTTGILQYAVAQLRKGLVQNVVYLAPRRILAEMTAERVKTMRPPTRDNTRFRFNVLLYHHGSLDKTAMYQKPPNEFYDDVDITSVIDKHDDGVEYLYKQERNFVSACINSIQCVPHNPDILIVDEIGMSVGNMFLNWTRQAKGTIDFGASEVGAKVPGHGVEFEVSSKDLKLIQNITDVMRNSRVTFLLEARMTKKLVDAYNAMYEWPTTMRHYLKNIAIGDKLPKGYSDVKVLKRWVSSKIKSGSTCVPKYSEEANKVCLEHAPVDVMIHNDSPGNDSDVKRRTIFDKVIEHPNHRSIKARIVAATVYENRTAVVYVSSASAGARVIKDIQAICADKGLKNTPHIRYVTAETLAAVKDKTAAVNEYINEARVIVLSNVIGAGPSYDQPHAFDEAYMIVDCSLGCPTVLDMIQLSARVRSIASKTLHISVESSRSPLTRTDIDKQTSLLTKYINFIPEIITYYIGIYKTSYALGQMNLHAKTAMRHALLEAYSVYFQDRDEYRLPEMCFWREKEKTVDEQDTQTVYKNGTEGLAKPTKRNKIVTRMQKEQSMAICNANRMRKATRRNNDMVRRLRKDPLRQHLVAGNKRSVYRNNVLNDDTTVPVKRYKLAQSINKNGENTKFHVAIPMPCKQSKRIDALTTDGEIVSLAIHAENTVIEKSLNKDTEKIPSTALDTTYTPDTSASTIAARNDKLTRS